ncbi:mitoguardin 1 isoform X2 [Phyllobates terribilis]|uniref:mitoguardin 1 isoform X2 n=1 Tax=Phyllobates terribilis TaxID=111132 RepID=UPI003CCB62D4
MAETQHPLRMAALRVVDFPLSLYNSLTQFTLLLKSSPGLKTIFAVTAVGTVSIIFLARRIKRRRGKIKSPNSSWEPDNLLLDSTRHAALEKGSSCSSSRKNLTLSLTSAKEKGSQLHLNGGLNSKYSGSVQSLASVRSINSCHSCNPWDKGEEEDIKLVNIPVTTPENLYLMGMELFEEALRRWEQALSFRNRQAEDEASCGSIRMGAGDAIAEENLEDIISAEFIHKLEALLQRAYRLQEEFEASLGGSDPASLANDIDKDTDMTVTDNGGEFGMRDAISIASNDSFMSATELTEHREMETTSLPSLNHCPLYEDAMLLAEEGRIYCRALRTDSLECGGDSDFLAKLHCIRQAFQVILSKVENREFLINVGRKILSSLIIKAKKNPRKFEAAYDEMMRFLSYPDSWSTMENELFGRGVKNMNFYDIFLDFIVLDSLEDLENPPLSIQNVVKNRWLNSSFRETAPDGFFAHFYAVCEQISPVLAWGFLAPRNALHELCCSYKDQVQHFLKDIFDLEKVRYCSVERLSEDILQSIHQRAESLGVYVAADSARGPSCRYKPVKADHLNLI